MNLSPPKRFRILLEHGILIMDIQNEIEEPEIEDTEQVQVWETPTEQ